MQRQPKVEPIPPAFACMSLHSDLPATHTGWGGVPQGPPGGVRFGLWICFCKQQPIAERRPDP